jgi:hypothetical protein
MARDKATITLDRAKAREAMAVTGAGTMSEVIDIALDRLLRTEQLRHDIAAYSQHPPTAAEMALGGVPVRLDLGDDGVDYDALYGGDR